MQAPYHHGSLTSPSQYDGSENSAASSYLSPPIFGFIRPRASEGQGWLAVLAGLTLVVLLTIVGFWTQPIINGSNLAVLYTLAVVVTALRWGRRAAIISAFGSALLFDHFFAPPLRSFGFSDISYLVTFIGLLTMGVLVSMLTLTAREEAEAARRKEAHTFELYSLTKSLVAESDLDRILDAIEHHIQETFRTPIIIWMPGKGGLAALFRSPDLSTDAGEAAAARWVFENGEEAGWSAARFSDSTFYYLPLKTWKGVVGVLGIQADCSKKQLPSEEAHLLYTFANQAALAITRAVLAREAQRTEVLQETDKLQKALLNSISHNLRSPLASVTGALNSLLVDGTLLDISTQREMLKAAQDEARRLDRLLQNLLDMTRLEGGVVHVKAEPCDVQDVVGSALAQLGDAARERLIIVNIPSNLPLVPMDFVLIVQVLVNLLDNALKYSAVELPVEVGAMLKGDQLQIRVADRGPGIPEQYLERVFEKFFRGAPTTAAGGSGLGLSICRGFVDAHHGRIWAGRRLHGGTEIIFSLPLEASR